MADRYVRSTDGSDADNGTTWALAKATLTGVAAIDTAGDRLFVSQSHAESTASAVTIALAGSIASPTQVICGNDAAEPPTAVVATASVTTTGANAIAITATAAYIYGLTFNVGTGASAANFTLNNATAILRFVECVIALVNTSASSIVDIGANSANYNVVHLKNTDISFGATGQSIKVAAGHLKWEGGATAGSAVTSLFSSQSGGSARFTKVEVSGVDLSSCATAVALVAVGAGNSPYGATFRNCKLPASWSGTLISGTPVSEQRVEMYNCDSGDTNYRLWVEDYAGSIKQETTIVRTGGANDGTTGLAWKMTTSASAEYPALQLLSPEIVVWSDTTGAKTVTVEIVHDSQGAGTGSKFQDDEIWLEAMSLNTSGFPLGTWTTDCKADVLATAANQADSTETWTTTGLASPVKQKLSVSITTAEKGFIHARVVMAKASKTAYICPLLTVA